MALRKWAEKQGAPLDALARATDGKQECFYYRSMVAGKSLAGVIQAVIAQALGRLPIPKLMSYQLADGATTVSFVQAGASTDGASRRARCCLARCWAWRPDRLTEGHRFQSDGRDPDRIGHQLCRRSCMTKAGSSPPSTPRRDLIAAALDASSRPSAPRSPATAPSRLQVDALLDEVTALVEWPAVYVGRFEDSFLQVPQECLILTMRTNQKYFPLFDADGTPAARAFSSSRNMEVADPSSIIDGNERVVQASPGGCPVLLRPGPQDAARAIGSPGSRMSCTTRNWAARPTRSQRVVALAGAHRPGARPGSGPGRARRACWPRPTC